MVGLDGLSLVVDSGISKKGLKVVQSSINSRLSLLWSTEYCSSVMRSVSQCVGGDGGAGIVFGQLWWVCVGLCRSVEFKPPLDQQAKKG